MTITSGTLDLRGGDGGSTTGSFSGAGTLEFDSGTYTVSGSVTVANVFFNNPTVAVNGPYNVATSTTLGGTVTFNAASTLQSLGATVTLNGGTTTFNSGEAVSIPTFNFNNGFVAGSDNITIPGGGAFNWVGGILTNSGTFTVSAGATGSLTTSVAKNFLAGALVDAGTITQTSAAANFTFGGGTLTIPSGGVYDIQGDVGISVSGGTNQINNAGTIQKSAGTGTSTIHVPLNNTGVFQAKSGILSETGTIAQYASGSLTGGTWNALTGGKLQLTTAANVTTTAATVLLDGAGASISTGSSGTTNLQSSLTTIAASTSFTVQNGATFTAANAVSAAGTLNVNGASTFTDAAGLTAATTGTIAGTGTIAANVANNGTVSPGVSGVGTLSITGTYGQSTSGSLSLDVGGTTAGQYDVLVVGGAAALTGALKVNLVNGFMLSSSTPAVQPLTYASHTNAFGSLSSPSSNNYYLSPNYSASPTSMSLQTSSMAIGAPSPKARSRTRRWCSLRETATPSRSATATREATPCRWCSA